MKKLLLKADLKGFKKGSIISVKFKDGQPVERYWRDRLKDAKIDNCVEIVSEKKVEEKISKKK